MRNAASYTLDPNLDVDQDYALMPQEENDRIFGAGGATWARFQARYPKMSELVTFSRVGYSANKKEAWRSWGITAATCVAQAGSTLQ